MIQNVLSPLCKLIIDKPTFCARYILHHHLLTCKQANNVKEKAARNGYPACLDIPRSVKCAHSEGKELTPMELGTLCNAADCPRQSSHILAWRSWEASALLKPHWPCVLCRHLDKFLLSQRKTNLQELSVMHFNDNSRLLHNPQLEASREFVPWDNKLFFYLLLIGSANAQQLIVKRILCGGNFNSRMICVWRNVIQIGHLFKLIDSMHWTNLLSSLCQFAAPAFQSHV